MLRIHTGLKKWSKRNLFDLHLQKMNPSGIHETCIKIAKSEVLFGQYRMDLKQEKYGIEVRNDDTIKRDQIFFISCNEHSIDWMHCIYVKGVF